MTKAIAMRTASGGRAFFKVVGWTAGAVMVMSVIAGAMIASGRGGSAAAADSVSEPGTERAAPPSIAGRWSGSYFGFGRRTGEAKCTGVNCVLTYDIVACKDAWCGIAVNGDKTCGAVGLHLARDAAQSQPAFKGEIEVAKGSAAYTIEAWLNQDEGLPPRLHMLGDTGAELVLMRRSFPFEAELARQGDAACTLEKATS